VHEDTQQFIDIERINTWNNLSTSKV